MERLADFSAIAGFGLGDLGRIALDFLGLFLFLGWFVFLWWSDKKFGPPPNGKTGSYY